MSYRIIYGDGDKDRRKPALGVIAVVIFFALGCFAFGGGEERLQSFRRMFFPWTQPQVQEALGNFREDMRGGASFSEAMEVFCRDLIYEASPIG